MGHEELFLDLHDRLPKEMIYERELLICRNVSDESAGTNARAAARFIARCFAALPA